MNFLCLCPVYGHPRSLIENAIACFNAQDYPADKRELLILDDLGNLEQCMRIARWSPGPRWSLMSQLERFPSLPAKYNYMRQTRVGFDVDAIAVWEVDDLYLPWHLSEAARSLQSHGWSQHKRVWSTYHGTPNQEPAAGRFHAALTMRRDFLESIGGWPETKRADFDQQLMGRLTKAGDQGWPEGPPSYVFRWADTGVPHGQASMKSGSDETWYDNYQPKFTSPITELTPQFDAAALNTFRQIEALNGTSPA